ncbi:TRP C-terminal domain-containing protein [Plasmodiophora brassicae]
MTFPGTSNPLLAGLSLYTPSMSLFVGPQPQDNIGPVTRPLAITFGDICDARTAGENIVRDKVVLLASGISQTCSFETVYLNYISSGAAAIIHQSTKFGVPGVYWYIQDGSHGARTRWHAMMYLDFIPPSQAIMDAMLDSAGTNVTVYPDPNAWVDTYQSWYYQTFVRFIPSLIFIASGLVAAYFFAIHMVLVRDDADSRNNYKSLPARVGTIARKISSAHTVLAIEMVTSTTIGVVDAASGFFSNSTLPDRLVLYMFMHFNGWGLACSVLSARVWYRHLHAVMEPVGNVSIVTRVLRGDYVWVTCFLCAASIIADTAGSVYFATFHLTSGVAIVTGAFILTMQLVLGTNLLIATVRFFLTARETTSTVSGAVVPNSRVPMQRVLRRLAACALGLALSMLLYCSGLLIIAGQQDYFDTPPGWTLAWSLGITGRALDSAFRVAMFRPRRRSNRCGVTSADPGHT